MGSFKPFSKIVIDGNGAPQKPDALEAADNAPALWVVVNNDAQNAHTVTIDPASFINKANNQPFNPLTSYNVLVARNVVKGQPVVLWALLKPGISGMSFGYDFAVDARSAKAAGRIDPDLDVVDPGSR